MLLSAEQKILYWGFSHLDIVFLDDIDDVSTEILEECVSKASVLVHAENANSSAGTQSEQDNVEIEGLEELPDVPDYSSSVLAKEDNSYGFSLDFEMFARVYDILSSEEQADLNSDDESPSEPDDDSSEDEQGELEEDEEEQESADSLELMLFED